MRSCPRYHELLREATETAEYQVALEGWTVSRPGRTRLVGLGRRGGVWMSPDSAHPMHPGLPDSPGELHGAVTGGGATTQGVEGSRHTVVPGEDPLHPSSQVVQIPVLLLTAGVPSASHLTLSGSVSPCAQWGW